MRHNQAAGPQSPDVLIFNRSLESGKRFKPGSKVKIRGTNLIGVVKEVYSNIEQVHWERGQPHFIVVELPEELLIAKPSQLKLRMV